MIYRIIILIAAILTTVSLSNSCSVRETLNEDNAIDVVKEIRASENKYLAKNGKYGSLKDLVENGLLKGNLSDGTDLDYNFNLENIDSKYTLCATPKQDESGQKQGRISFYLNESGVIRASYDADVDANDKSEMIKNQ